MKKMALEVENIPLHYNGKVGNMMSSSFSLRACHFSVCEDAVHFWRKGSLYENVLCHVN